MRRMDWGWRRATGDQGDEAREQGGREWGRGKDSSLKSSILWAGELRAWAVFKPSFLPPSHSLPFPQIFCVICLRRVLITTGQHGQDPLPHNVESSAEEILQTSPPSVTSTLGSGRSRMLWERPGPITQTETLEKLPRAGDV